MEPPPVQYVTTSDGFNIAYGVSGSGTPLVFLPGTFEHVQLAWQFPGQQPWLEGLAARFRLIQYDPRGTGMSTRGLKETHIRRDYQRDLEAVVDRLNLERFVLLAVSHGVYRAVDFASRHSDQVIALILGTSGLPESPALFHVVPGQDWDAFLFSVVPRDVSREEAHRQVALFRQAYDQRDFVLKAHASVDDVDELLQALSVPMLVLHARDYALTPSEEGMRKAQLSGAPFVLIDGTSAYGDSGQGIRAMESFLVGLTAKSAPSVAAPDGLSSREMEVLRLLAAGRSNQQIADDLVISLNTVYRHVSHIFAKTGAGNRTQAASYAHVHSLA